MDTLEASKTRWEPYLLSQGRAGAMRSEAMYGSASRCLMDMQVQLSAYGHHIGDNLKDLEAFMDKHLKGRC